MQGTAVILIATGLRSRENILGVMRSLQQFDRPPKKLFPSER